MKSKQNNVSTPNTNDPLFPNSQMMTDKTLKVDYTENMDSTLRKKAQKTPIDNHHPISERKPRQLSGRHH